jgi:hypothetical protein
MTGDRLPRKKGERRRKNKENKEDREEERRTGNPRKGGARDVVAKRNPRFLYK